MKHKLVIAIALGVAVVGIGSTVAWAATHGSFSGHMGQRHMQQAGNAHMMGSMDRADMRAFMARIHPGLDAATFGKLTAQCTKVMKDMSSMHGSGGMHDMDDMMGGSGYGGMMGGSGSGSPSGGGRMRGGMGSGDMMGTS